MKKILTVLFILQAGLNAVDAQTNPDTLKAVVPYSVFPIGAMRYSDGTDTLTKMYGMNFHWYGFPNGNTDTTLAVHHWPDNPGTVTPIADPFYWDTTSTSKPTYSDLNSLLQNAAYSNDIRVWLPGTSGITSEYNYAWNYRKGSLQTTPEWLIKTDSVNYGDTVLSDLGNAQTDPFVGDGYAGVTPDKKHIYTFSYDFVLFFSNLDLGAVGNTDSLYSLEFWVKPANSGTYSLRTTQLITKGLYNSTLQIAKTQPTGHVFHADSLFKWFDKPVRQTNLYKLLRTVLNLREDYSYNSDSTVSAAPQVDVRLRSYKRIPIFVRGLRIRDWRAQRLLGGFADSALKFAISQLLTQPASKAFKSWAIGNENVYKDFHSWAYVNNLLTHNGASPADILSPPWNQNDVFMRILRDQTESGGSGQSGIIWEEQSVFNVPWVFRGTNSYLPNNLYVVRPSSITALRYAAGSRPLPGGLTSDSANLFKNAVYVLNDYTQFTNETQNNILGYSSEANGGGAGDYQSVLGNARSAYELDPTHPIPYYLMAPTIVTPWSFPKWSIDSLFLTRRDSLFFYLRDSLSKSPGLAWAMADTQAGLWGDSVYYFILTAGSFNGMGKVTKIVP